MKERPLQAMAKSLCHHAVPSKPLHLRRSKLVPRQDVTTACAVDCKALGNQQIAPQTPRLQRNLTMAALRISRGATELRSKVATQLSAKMDETSTPVNLHTNTFFTAFTRAARLCSGQGPANRARVQAKTVRGSPRWSSNRNVPPNSQQAIPGKSPPIQRL